VSERANGWQPQAFRPAQLAERWQCSERHVRNLINRGELKFFRLGGKLVRVPRAAVEEFEQCQSLHCGRAEAVPDAALRFAEGKEVRKTTPNIGRKS
jgi:excisionase family DNA binding protein